MEIDPDKVEIQAELAALREVVTRLFVMSTIRLSQPGFDQVVSDWVTHLETVAYPHFPPALSDAFADEVRQRVQSMLNEATQNRAALLAALDDEPPQDT